MSYDQESSSHSLASEEEDEEDNPPAGVDDVDLLDVHLTVEDNGLEIRIE